MCPKDADGMANIVDPDQTIQSDLSDRVYSVCQTCLSKYLRSLP